MEFYYDNILQKQVNRIINKGALHFTKYSPLISIYVPTERQIDGQIRIYGDSSYKTRAVSLMTLSFAAVVIISSGVFRFHQNSASQCVVNVNIYPNLFNSLYLIPQSGISKSIMYCGISPVFFKESQWFEKIPTQYGMKMMGLCKKDVTPLLTHWSYVFLARTHRNVVYAASFGPLHISVHFSAT